MLIRRTPGAASLAKLRPGRIHQRRLRAIGHLDLLKANICGEGRRSKESKCGDNNFHGSLDVVVALIASGLNVWSRRF
jgi:hypothetical protein